MFPRTASGSAPSWRPKHDGRRTPGTAASLRELRDRHSGRTAHRHEEKQTYKQRNDASFSGNGVMETCSEGVSLLTSRHLAFGRALKRRSTPMTCQLRPSGSFPNNDIMTLDRWNHSSRASWSSPSKVNHLRRPSSDAKRCTMVLRRSDYDLKDEQQQSQQGSQHQLHTKRTHYRTQAVMNHGTEPPATPARTEAPKKKVVRLAGVHLSSTDLSFEGDTGSSELDMSEKRNRRPLSPSHSLVAPRPRVTFKNVHPLDEPYYLRPLKERRRFSAPAMWVQQCLCSDKHQRQQIDFDCVSAMSGTSLTLSTSSVPSIPHPEDEVLSTAPSGLSFLSPESQGVVNLEDTTPVQPEGQHQADFSKCCHVSEDTPFLDVLSAQRVLLDPVTDETKVVYVPLGLRVPDDVLLQMVQGMRYVISTDFVQRRIKLHHRVGISYLNVSTARFLAVVLTLMGITLVLKLACALAGVGTTAFPLNLLSVPLEATCSVIGYTALRYASRPLMYWEQVFQIVNVSVLTLMFSSFSDMLSPALSGLPMALGYFQFSAIIIMLICVILMLLIFPRCWNKVQKDGQELAVKIPLERLEEKLDAAPFIQWYFSVPEKSSQLRNATRHNVTFPHYLSR